MVDDHGKSVAGAKISFDYLHASNPLESVPTVALSDSKGRFEFSCRKRDFAAGDLSGPWWLSAMIMATKPGYGPAGGRSIEFETSGRLLAEQSNLPAWRRKGASNVLKLASDDVPVRGRILDTEGRPVSGRTGAGDQFVGRAGRFTRLVGSRRTATGSQLGTARESTPADQLCQPVQRRVRHWLPPFGPMRVARSRCRAWVASGSPILP